jgi:hypothetical protein
MARWSFALRVADYAFALEGEDAELEQLARTLFSGASTSDQEGVSERFSLCRSGDFYLLLEGDKEIYRSASLSAFFQEVEWALTQSAMNGLDHFFQIHAGGIARKGKGELLVGFPDSGKTSLVLGLASVGAAVLSDEVALIDAQTLSVFSFPRDLIVHRTTQQLFAEQMSRLDSPLWKIFPTYRYISLVELGFSMPVGPAPIARLIFPVLKPGTSFAHRTLGAAETARRLLEQAFNLGRWGEEGIELIGRLADGVPAVEVCFADARTAAEWLVGAD